MQDKPFRVTSDAHAGSGGRRAHVGSGVERIGPIRFLTRRPEQPLFVLCLILGFFCLT